MPSSSPSSTVAEPGDDIGGGGGGSRRQHTAVSIDSQVYTMPSGDPVIPKARFGGGRAMLQQLHAQQQGMGLRPPGHR